MTMLTNQEIFDRVYKHLMTQGKRAIAADGNCRYRGEGGTQCAVGCLIPDAVYTPDIEGCTMSSARNGTRKGEVLADALEASGLPRSSWDLLADLQEVHDSRRPEYWADALTWVAKRYGLTVPQ